MYGNGIRDRHHLNSVTKTKTYVRVRLKNWISFNILKIRALQYNLKEFIILYCTVINK